MILRNQEPMADCVTFDGVFGLQTSSADGRGDLGEEANFDDPDHAAWFVREVHPHERSLRSYVRRSFPFVHDPDDLVQESFLRIWQARAAHPIKSAKAFLFTIARNLAFDLARREKISPVAPVRDLSTLSVIEESRGVADSVSRNESVDLLAEAIAALPTRCREVIKLRKLKNLSQRESAAQLGISERTVEVQVARGVKRCEQYLRERGVTGYYIDEGQPEVSPRCAPARLAAAGGRR